MALHNVEITGDGTPRTLAYWCAVAVTAGNTSLSNAPAMRPTWIQFDAYKNNVADVRVGDQYTDVNHGLRMVAGSGFMLPPIGVPDQHVYELPAVYIFVAANDKVSVVWDA